MENNNSISGVAPDKIDNKIDFKNSSLLDDAWFTSSLDDNPKLATFILQIIIGRKDLVVTKITTQKKLKNIKKRSIILDAHAYDSKNRQYNIEIQKAKNRDVILRSRYLLSLLDSYNLRKNNDFKKLPETYIIFICDFDLFNKGKPIYLVDRFVNGEFKFNDLEHIIFVNCKYEDMESDIGKLIHDMKSKTGEQKCYNIFVENEEGGEDKMGQQCEQLRQEGFNKTALEYIISMLEEGADIDFISKVTKKSKDEIIAIKKDHNL